MMTPAQWRNTGASAVSFELDFAIHHWYSYTTVYKVRRDKQIRTEKQVLSRNEKWKQLNRHKEKSGYKNISFCRMITLIMSCFYKQLRTCCLISLTEIQNFYFINID